MHWAPTEPTERNERNDTTRIGPASQQQSVERLTIVIADLSVSSSDCQSVAAGHHTLTQCTALYRYFLFYFSLATAATVKSVQV